MKEALTTLITNLAEIVKVKSLVTLAMTATLVLMLTGKFNPSQEFVALYCTSYGSIMTYYFTKDNNKIVENSEEIADNLPIVEPPND